jgi:integrase
MRLLDRMRTGRLKVFPELTNWWYEFRLCSRDDKGQPKKVNDHLMDATRYLEMSGLQRAKNEYEAFDSHRDSRWMRAKGVPTDQIQIQLGHRRLGVTERYAEYDPNYLKEATAAIEAFFRPVSAQSFEEKWCRARGLNPRPSVYKTAALPLS